MATNYAMKRTASAKEYRDVLRSVVWGTTAVSLRSQHITHLKNVIHGIKIGRSYEFISGRYKHSPARHLREIPMFSPSQWKRGAKEGNHCNAAMTFLKLWPHAISEPNILTPVDVQRLSSRTSHLQGIRMGGGGEDKILLSRVANVLLHTIEVGNSSFVCIKWMDGKNL